MKSRRGDAPSARPHLLLAAAVALELRPFARRLGLQVPSSAIAQGNNGDRRVSLIATGMGRPGDAVFARALRSLQPMGVINVGIAGALDEQHPAGSTWIVEQWRASAPPHEPCAAADARLAARISEALDAAGVQYGRACAVTVDEPLHDADERDRLRVASGAHLVEMEGAAWARIAADLGIPFAAVRVVSDHADRAMPGPRPREGRRDWLLRDDGSPRKHRLALALIASRAWLRPFHHIRAVKAAGAQFRTAVESLEAIAGALLPPA